MTSCWLSIIDFTFLFLFINSQLAEVDEQIMSKVWLKIVALVVVVIGLIIIANVISISKSEPKPKPKTFYDVAEEDKKRFLAEPQQVKEPLQEQKTVVNSKTPVEPVQPAEPTLLYFKPLSEIDTIEAEKLLNVAVPGRSIGRLPMTGFNLMVDSCRQIIQRWPDSWYAYRAKQMLADMPERFRRRYRVTQQELDVSKFAEPRPGTKPFNMKAAR